MNHWAIPCDIWKAMEEEKKAEKQMTQKQRKKKLDFKTVTGPSEFTRAGIL